MSNNLYLTLAIIAMAAVTFMTRALPALLPKRVLDTPWLHRLNESLPLSVLVLLILISLNINQDSLTFTLNSQNSLLIAQVVAVGFVLLVYHFTRQLLVSMVVGIIAINAILWGLSFV